jgi:hypothetical protein
LYLSICFSVQVSKASELQELTRSLPELEDLTVWTAMEAATVGRQH